MRHDLRRNNNQNSLRPDKYRFGGDTGMNLESVQMLPLLLFKA